MREFALSKMRLLQAKEGLLKILRGQYKPNKWEAALKAIMDAESYMPKALASLDKLKHAATRAIPPALPPVMELNRSSCSKELVGLEVELMTQVSALKEQNCLHGNLPTLNNILAPEGKNEMEEEVSVLTDAELVNHVRQELAKPVVEEVKVKEVEVKKGPTQAKMLAAAHILEAYVIGTNTQVLLSLSQHLLRWQAEMVWLEVRTAMQTNISAFFQKK
jgi:hypothetical protein